MTGIKQVLNGLLEAVASAIDAIPFVGEGAAQAFRDKFLFQMEETKKDTLDRSPIPDLVNGIEEWMSKVPLIGEQAGQGFRDGFTSALEEAAVVTKQYESLGKKSFDGLADAIIDFTKGGKDAFKDFAKSIIEDMLKIQLRASLSGLFGGGAGGGLGGIFAGLFNQGGHIGSGKVGLVGETGPEFVRGPATVTSARDTARMMNGMGGGMQNTTYNFNYSGVPDQRWQKDVQAVIASSPQHVGAAQTTFMSNTQGLGRTR